MRRAAALLALAGAALVASWIALAPRDDGGGAIAPQPATAERALRVETEAARVESASTRDAANPLDLPPVDLDACDRALDLFGVVVDPAGAPVAGASVETLRYPGWRTLLIDESAYRARVAGPATRSATDGTFALRLERGEVVELRVHAPGFGIAGRSDCVAGERMRIELRPAAALEVFATDARGAPLAGVHVRTWRSDHGRLDEREAITDDAGRAAFTDLAAGMRVVDGGHASGAYPWNVTLLFEGETARLDVEVPDGRDLAGIVTDSATGRPVVHAIVGMKRTLDGAVSTDTAGRYALRGCTDDSASEIHVVAEGYGRAAKPVPSEGLLDFALDAGDEAIGRIVAADRRPVSDAAVTALAGNEAADTARIDSSAAVSRSDGTFRVTSLRRDLPHTLMVLARGHGRVLLDFDPRPGSAGTIDLGEIVLPAARSIAGRASDASGKPLAAARISLEGWNADRLRLRSTVAAPPYFGGIENRCTDDLGRFLFTDLPPGEYSLSLDDLPSVTRTVALPADHDVTDFELRVPRSDRTLTALVVGESGAPVPGALVDLEGTRSDFAVTDAAGRVTFDGLSDEWVELSVHTYAVSPAPPVIALAGGEEVRLVSPEVDEIAGTVVDDAGHPLPFMDLMLRGMPWMWGAQTDEDGQFALAVRGGESVDVMLTGTRRFGRERTAWRGSIDSVTPPAEDVVLRAHEVRLDLALAVRVVDPDGNPVANAGVDWSVRPPVPEQRAYTDANGVAQLERLEDAPLRVHAVAPLGMRNGWQPSETTAAAPGSPLVELRLRRAARLHVRAVDAAGQPVATARVRLIGDAEQVAITEVDGRAELLVPEGASFEIEAIGRISGGAMAAAQASDVRAERGEYVLRLVPSR